MKRQEIAGAVLLALAAAWIGRATAAAPAGAPALPTQPAAVARQAFEHLKEGLATSRWDPFFAMLADDFTFWFPSGKYLGLHRGKATAMEFFHYVSASFPGGIRVVEVLRETGSGQTFVFEFRDEGMLRGEPYKNRVALSFDVCGDKICGYREYFGSDGKVN